LSALQHVEHAADQPPIWLTTAMMAMAIRVKIPYSMAVA
jgi:hypothetical protein